jgi:hypothetical protein
MHAFTPPENIHRYFALAPRLDSLLFHLRQYDPSLPPSSVEQALGRELVEAARRIVSRDSFAKGLRPLTAPEIDTRDGILRRLEEAELALSAFHALYYCADGDDISDEAFWRFITEDERGKAFLNPSNDR